MIPNGGDIAPVHIIIRGVMLPDQHLDGGRILDDFSEPIISAVGSSEDMLTGYDGAPTIWCLLLWRHQAHLPWILIGLSLLPTHYPAPLGLPTIACVRDTVRICGCGYFSYC